MKQIKLFNRNIFFAMSKSWQGWDVGLFNTRVATKGKYSIRSFVFWRFCIAFQINKVEPKQYD